MKLPSGGLVKGVTGDPICFRLEGEAGVLPMSLQLTPEQEQRIQTVVNAGAYRSAEEALDAAVAAVEVAAAPDFEGSQEELEKLLLEGLNSGEPVEAAKASGTG